MEEVLRPFVAAQLGRELRRDRREFIHPTLPLIGHVDYRASSLNDEPRPVVDMKTSLGWGSVYRFGENGTDEVDPDVFMQMQGYLLLTKAIIAFVAALLPGSKLKIYTIHADPELHKMIITGIKNFWWHVETNTPPPITALADAKTRWPKQISGTTVSATAGDVVLIEALKTAKLQMKELEEETEALELNLKKRIGDAETMLGPDGKPLCTWKSQQLTRLDTDAIKAAGLYTTYQRTTETRVLRFTKAKVAS